MNAPDSVDSVDGELAGRPAVDLGALDDDLLATRRFDQKAVLSVEQAVRLIGMLPDDWQVVTVNHARVLPYHTVYFDTPDFLLFRAHRQERNHRFKVRTRRYSDRQVMLEVKMRERDGRTTKLRRPHDMHGILSADARQFVADVPGVARTRHIVDVLQPAGWTAYHRVMMRAWDGSERLTFDLGLTLGANGVRVSTEKVVVESKASVSRSGMLGLLRQVGARPVTLSKYAACVHYAYGFAANRWQPALRRLQMAV